MYIGVIKSSFKRLLGVIHIGVIGITGYVGRVYIKILENQIGKKMQHMESGIVEGYRD